MKEEKREIQYPDIPIFLVYFLSTVFLSIAFTIYIQRCPDLPTQTTDVDIVPTIPLVRGSLARGVTEEADVKIYRSISDALREADHLLLSAHKCIIVTQVTKQANKNIISFGMYEYPVSSFVTNKESVVAVKPPSIFRTFFWNWKFSLMAIMVLILIATTYRVIRKHRALQEAFSNPLEKQKIVEEDQPIYSLDLEYEHIKTLCQSNDMNTQTLGIIRADALLERLLRAHGMSGDTILDLMKETPKTLIANIDEVWTARRVRNRIAHTEKESVYEDEIRNAGRIYLKILSHLLKDFKDQSPKSEDMLTLPQTIQQNLPPSPTQSPNTPPDTQSSSSQPRPLSAPDNIPI